MHEETIVCMYRNLSNTTRNTIVWCHTSASPDYWQAWMTTLNWLKHQLKQQTFLERQSHCIWIRWPDSKAETPAACLSLSSFVCVFLHNSRSFQNVHVERRDSNTQKSNITNSSLILDRNKITVEHSRDENGRNQINAEITASTFQSKGKTKLRQNGEDSLNTCLLASVSLLTFGISMHLFLRVWV